MSDEQVLGQNASDISSEVTTAEAPASEAPRMIAVEEDSGASAQDATQAVEPPSEPSADAGASPDEHGAAASASTVRDDGASQNYETVARAIDSLCEDVRRVQAVCDETLVRLASLETAVEATTKQVSFLPPQVRQLSGKVEGLTTSMSEPRYRAALLSLLGVYDLVDQVLRTLPDADGDTHEAEHRRNYEVVRTQLRQILDANGLTEISTDGAFDPTVHRVAERKSVEDPARANLILEVVRPGFRTEQSVLRYSEVVVGHYAPSAESSGDAAKGAKEKEREAAKVVEEKETEGAIADAINKEVGDASADGESTTGN
jgi:molecular chaperone GrpE (heat shock protein)